jgi:CheY-like chemotaxis protein
VIDDEELVRLSAEAQLMECGYQVLLAENGPEGIDLYRGNLSGIDLVLLDLVMPIMSGKEVFDQLKALNPKVKVLLSSGYKQDRRVGDILAGGARGFIQKPYSLGSLSQQVSEILKT